MGKKRLRKHSPARHRTKTAKGQMPSDARGTPMAGRHPTADRPLDEQLCSRCAVLLSPADLARCDATPGIARVCTECITRTEQERLLLCPSRVVDRDWIYAAECPRLALRKYPVVRRGTWRPGKWLLFLKPELIDEVWRKIVIAEQEGRLGGSSKVSTKLRTTSVRAKEGKHVICVYTRDHEDAEEVMRVRSELTELGFRAPIAYKTDDATWAGKYSGDGPVAKWFL